VRSGVDEGGKGRRRGDIEDEESKSSREGGGIGAIDQENSALDMVHSRVYIVLFYVHQQMCRKRRAHVYVKSLYVASRSHFAHAL
jgi:hypothetical protein